MARTPIETLQRFEMEIAASAPFSRRSRELSVLGGLNALEAEVTKRIAEVVQACREQGASWAEIATTLNVSKQAAHERFGQHGMKGPGTGPEQPLPR